MEIQDFLGLFPKVRKQPRREAWKALCPCHADHKPSLNITYNDKGIACYCHACGANGKAVCDALGISVSELWFKHSKPKGQIDTVYDYMDYRTGEYLYSRIRFQGKEWDIGVRIDGKITAGKPKDLHGIYTPDLEALRKAELIVITEGEKDCNTVYREGLQSFTYGGANEWQKEFAYICKGKDVILFIDNDPAGKHVGDKIIKDLQGKARTITAILPTPNITHGDITDYIEDGGDIFGLISEHRQGTTQSQDIGNLLCDDTFNSLSMKQQNLYMRIIYQFPLLNIDTPQRKGCIYLNQALLSDIVGIYSRNDIKGLQKDIKALIDKGYIKLVQDGFTTKKRSIYQVL